MTLESNTYVTSNFDRDFPLNKSSANLATIGSWLRLATATALFSLKIEKIKYEFKGWLLSRTFSQMLKLH